MYINMYVCMYGEAPANQTKPNNIYIQFTSLALSKNPQTNSKSVFFSNT